MSACKELEGRQFRLTHETARIAGRQALQAAAYRLSPEIIRKRLDYWTWVV